MKKIDIFLMIGAIGGAILWCSAVYAVVHFVIKYW